MIDIPLGSLSDEQRSKDSDDFERPGVSERSSNSAAITTLKANALAAGLAAIEAALGAAEGTKANGRFADIATELCDIAKQSTRAAHAYAAGAIYLKDDTEPDHRCELGISPCAPLSSESGRSRSSETRCRPGHDELAPR